jgi:hypothetical protein
VRKNYQGKPGKSKGKFEVLGRNEVSVQVPLPLVEVWEDLQPRVEQLTGEAGMQILRAILEDEVARRVGPPHRPAPESGAVRWGRQPGYVIFSGQKVAVTRPRVRTREGEEVGLDSYARLQHDGRRQRAVREGIVAGLTSRNYHRVVKQAGQRPTAGLLMTHPGLGPITALATDVFLGDPKRFRDGKALASYIGIIPSEHSSGGRQRLGGLSKQGNPLLRFLWCEAAVHAVRRDPELRRFYRRKLVQKGLGKARVAAARKLGIRLWIMLRDQIDYHEFCRRGQMQQRSGDACAGMPGPRYGAKSHRLID